MARARAGRSGARALLIVALLALLLGGGFLWRQWRGAGPLAADTSVQVPDGASLGAAARLLEGRGVIRSAAWFRRLGPRLGSGDPIRAGEYAIPARASAAAVLDILQHARPLQRLVTIPEGTPSIVARDLVARAPYLSGTIAVPAEGSLLPDSYAYARGETRAGVVRRMQAAMTTTIDALWKARKPATVARSPREALILASIVEKETGVAAERRTVAAVYSNRLRMGMPLQADPTVIYPVTRGRPLGRRILASELHARNGYNTYAMPGLPAGPICNPGRASIAAVLDPGPSAALYFVADGKGGHVFANTLAEHSANVQRWYAIRRARGEM